MDVQIINPIDRPDWDDVLLESGDDCFFHTAAWARTFRDSYGYEPVYFSAFRDGKLALLVPMMDVRSIITGRRGVSLPYTDSCPAFASDHGALEGVFGRIADHGRRNRWRYAEFRGPGLFPDGTPVFETFATHDLDLKGPESALFARLKENNQRNIKKALKAGLSVQVDDSRESVETFYRLNCLTRKRHGLPPQPPAFFRNVFERIISRGYGTVVSASHEGRAISASMFFRFGGKAVFKYGASDEREHGHRPNNLVMWEGIKWHREQGCTALSLGRTEADNPGLLQYKRSWGGEESRLDYFRYDLKEGRFAVGRPAGLHYQRIFAKAVPVCVLRMIGKVSYRHFG